MSRDRSQAVGSIDELVALLRAGETPPDDWRVGTEHEKIGLRARDHSVVPFEGEAAVWLRRFKYPQPGLFGLDPAAEAVATELIREAAHRAPGPAPDLIVPVPLHPLRLRERGFNPAGLLAAALGRAHRLPVDSAALTRIRDTPSQTQLARSQRARNVSGAFRARNRALPGRIWLVDDVVTTGSTLREAARSLQGSGARRIVAVCAARTLEIR